MYILRMIALTLILGLVAVGCSQGADEAEVEAPADDAAAAPAEPEPEPIALPEGFPEIVKLYPDMEITAVETIDAEKQQFKITGLSKKGVENVLKYYEKYFPENGWVEDMNMWQEGTVIISSSKDGMMYYVEAKEGGGGCYVTTSTGKM